MEYLYQQQPKPTNTTGVPVTLIATNENGEATNYWYSHKRRKWQLCNQWTPPSTGIYKITANFAGTNSYWYQRRIAIGVTEAPASPATQTTSTSPTTTTPTETSSPMATTPAPTLSTASPTPLHNPIAASQKPY